MRIRISESHNTSLIPTIITIRNISGAPDHIAPVSEVSQTPSTHPQGRVGVSSDISRENRAPRDFISGRSLAKKYTTTLLRCFIQIENCVDNGYI